MHEDGWNKHMGMYAKYEEEDTCMSCMRRRNKHMGMNAKLCTKPYGAHRY
jgi:hypothetical protein